MNVITSIPSLINFKREDISHNAILKRYALLFDQIIFNRYGAPLGKGKLVESLGELVSLLVIPNGDIKNRLSLGKVKEFCDIFIDCWDVVKNPEEFESLRFQILDDETQKRIGEFSYREVRKQNNLPDDSFKFDIDEVKEISGDLYSDIGLTMLALSEGIDITPSYSPIIANVMVNESHVNGGECYQVFTDDMLVPDFDAFSWEEILELRKDKYIISFRKVVQDLINNASNINTALITKVNNDLWALAEDAKPKIGKTVLGAIASNLPSPIIVNPIGVGTALKEIYDARESDKKYGHVFFVQNMRKIRC